MPGETETTLRDKLGNTAGTVAWTTGGGTSDYTGYTGSGEHTGKDDDVGGRSGAILQSMAEDKEAEEAKQAAADAARADIIKRSATGDVTREDYLGGRHTYGMNQADYIKMMQSIPPEKYGEMFPLGAGIPKILQAIVGAVGGNPGIGIGMNIINALGKSDAGTMAKDLSNPFINLFNNIFGKKTKATNPEAVNMVDNSGVITETVSPHPIDNQQGISPMDQGLAEYYNQLKMQGPQGEEVIDDFSETIEDVPIDTAMISTSPQGEGFNQNNQWAPWKMGESGHLLDPALNPGLDLSSYGNPGIESWTPAKEQQLNALLAQILQGYDNGIGSLTEPNNEAIEALKAQIMSNPVNPNFGDLSGLYGINANALDPLQYIQDQTAIGNPPNINTGLIPMDQEYNKGGIASLQFGGDPGYEPGAFTSSTTVTDEETFDINPYQRDPGIMSIGDLEDLFEEAKVKESVFDKLKYINNTMHG